METSGEVSIEIREIRYVHIRICSIPVTEFQDQGYQIRKIFAKNQHKQRKLLNFENSDFFRSNSFIFELKVEKMSMDISSTHFVPLISILAPKMMKE